MHNAKCKMQNVRGRAPHCARRSVIRILHFAFCILTSPLLLVGCGSESDSPNEQTVAEEELEENPARSQVVLGPVRVTAEVEPGEASLADEPTLTLSIDYEQGVTIRKPPFGEALGDFIIRDFREPLPEVRDGREIVRRIYTLEPTRTGTLPIHPIGVTFVDDRPDGDGQEHTVETEALSVEITSMVEGEIPSLGDLRPMAPPVELSEPETAGAWWWWLLLPAVMVAAAIGWWFWRRRRRAVEAAPLTPQELAYLELQKLITDGWAERDVKQYYVELTGVVRRYIERTTAIRAPEQTTEEFLREVSRRATFPAEENARLREFLESADLVKFAAHHPRGEDIEESFQRANAFIGLPPAEVAA